MIQSTGGEVSGRDKPLMPDLRGTHVGAIGAGARERGFGPESSGDKVMRRFKTVLAHLQTGWSIVGITLVLVVLVEGGFRTIFAVRDRMTAVPEPDPRVVAEGYGGANWPVVHYRELKQLQERWQPYVYFRQRPFRGETITIGTDGLRSTWQSSMQPEYRDPRRSVKILTLGGSSLWGFGARDDQTIPSLLAHSLHEKGWRVELKNLAEIGYVSTQEVIALARQLQAGYRPDVVIFYDGVNDTTSALLQGEPGVTTNEINRVHEFNILQSPARLAAAFAVKLIKDSGSYRFAQTVRRRLDGEATQAQIEPAAAKVPDVPEGILQTYEANVTLVKALAKSFGFRPLFFWQPTVFTKAKLVAVEREEALRFAWAEAYMTNVYGLMKSSPQLKSEAAFHDLSRIFDDTQGLAFIDYCHTTETANAQIASAMSEKVLEALVAGSQSQ
jgi:lysophospholipase L1-like esterase